MARIINWLLARPTYRFLSFNNEKTGIFSYRSINGKEAEETIGRNTSYFTYDYTSLLKQKYPEWMRHQTYGDLVVLSGTRFTKWLYLHILGSIYFGNYEESKEIYRQALDKNNDPLRTISNVSISGVHFMWQLIIRTGWGVIVGCTAPIYYPLYLRNEILKDKEIVIDGKGKGFYFEIRDKY